MVRALFDAGLLSEGPFELIEGEILHKMGKRRPDVHVTMRALGWLIGVFGLDYVQKEDPIALDEHNEPEPDCVVLTHPAEYYLAVGTPPASDVRLVIEVADSTLAEDRRIKSRLYAMAGIPEYWIVDITGRQLLVHRVPQNDVYTSVVAVTSTESIACLAAPDAPVRVSSLLP
ncbi:MAG: Uma2 family endonuclease [Capsulimonadales bacterium]|nr:Uma2 family endonuclease [Capsulimonadales bacterium]